MASSDHIRNPAEWSVDQLRGAEQAVGRAPDKQAFEAAAEAAMAAVDPLEDAVTSADYRRDLTRTVTRRALEQAAA